MTAAAGTPDRHPSAASGRGGGVRSGRLRIRGVTRFQVLVTLTVVAALAILLLPVVVINHSREVAERELQEKLAQMADDGYAVTLEEVGRRYVYPPEDDNAALLFEQANHRLDIPNRLRDELPPYGEEWPELGEPIPPEWVPHIRELLELNEEAIALYREAARLPEARYPADFTLGHDLLIPHAGRLREAARFFSTLGIWQAGNEEWDQAADSLEILFAGGRSLRDEPLLISQLTRIAITGIGSDAIERMLAAGAPPPSFLVRIQALLENEANDDFMMRRALVGEMAFGIHEFDAARRNPEAYHEFVGGTNLLSGARAWIYTFSDALVRDELFYLEVMKDFFRAAEEPLPDRLEQVEQIDRVVERHRNDRSTPTKLTAQITPTISGVMTAEALIIARSRATLILVALERFRVDHGHLPDTLDELAPEYLDSLPEDPISGESFGYRIDDGWAFVTSEGEIRGEPLESRLPAAR